MLDEKIKKILWMIGFNAAANWMLTPVLEREYDPITGECINPIVFLNPGDEFYQDPEIAYNQHIASEIKKEEDLAGGW